MITGIGYPLPPDALELARDPRFAYLFSSHDGSGKSGDDDGSDGDYADQALKHFRML